MAQSAAYRSQGQWADRQAVIERQQGNYEAARAGDQATRQLASMRGAYTSAGVALEGSPLTILEDSAREASLDQQAIRYGATLRSQASTFEAGQARRNASSARTGAIIGAISPFVDAFSQQRQNNQMRSMIRNPFLAGSG